MTELESGDQHDESQAEWDVKGGPDTRLKLGDQFDKSTRRVRVEDFQAGQRASTTKLWVTGLFWIVLLVVVAVVVLTISKHAPLIFVPVVLLAGILAYCIVAAMILRTTQELSEKNFLTLMRISLQRLPLVEQQVQKAKDPDSAPP